jgi:hypothetical protein
MKRILVLFILLSLAIAPFKASSINYKNKQLALIAFNLTISPNMLEKLNTLENHFPDVKNQKNNKVIKKIKDMTWIVLEERLQREIGMYILPINAYGKEFDYDQYEYPNTSINKAIRRGISKYYMRIDMTIDFEEISKPSVVSSTLKNIIDTTNKTNKVELPQPKAKVSITLTTFSEKGIMPIDKFTGNFTAIEPWVFEAPLLDGLVNDNPFVDTNTLMGLFNTALSSLTINFTL